MIDDLYVLARLHELSREFTQLAASRKAQAILGAPASSGVAPLLVAREPLGEPVAPWATA